MDTRFVSLHTAFRQGGAILFVGLILLVVLSFLGFYALRSATLQERMAGNLRDRAIAFQAAESALSAAEEYLAGVPAGNAVLNTDKKDCASAGVFRLQAGVPYFVSQSPAEKYWDGGKPAFWNDYPWDKSNCFHTANVRYLIDADKGKPGKSADLPRYVIEELPPGGGAAGNFYRVTALGYGGGRTSGTKVILQATYAGS